MRSTNISEADIKIDQSSLQIGVSFFVDKRTMSDISGGFKGPGDLPVFLIRLYALPRKGATGRGSY